MSTQTITRPAAATTLTEKQAIRMLQGYALERRSALLAYPNAKGVSEKLLAIDEIVAMLDDANTKMPRAACVIILRTWMKFRYIAPTSTQKIFVSYTTKVDLILAACRLFLGRQQQ